MRINASLHVRPRTPHPHTSTSRPNPPPKDTGGLVIFTTKPPVGMDFAQYNADTERFVDPPPYRARTPGAVPPPHRLAAPPARRPIAPLESYMRSLNPRPFPEGGMPTGPCRTKKTGRCSSTGAVPPHRPTAPPPHRPTTPPPHIHAQRAVSSHGRVQFRRRLYAAAH